MHTARIIVNNTIDNDILKIQSGKEEDIAAIADRKSGTTEGENTYGNDILDLIGRDSQFDAELMVGNADISDDDSSCGSSDGEDEEEEVGDNDGDESKKGDTDTEPDNNYDRDNDEAANSSEAESVDGEESGPGAPESREQNIQRIGDGSEDGSEVGDEEYD